MPHRYTFSLYPHFLSRSSHSRTVTLVRQLLNTQTISSYDTITPSHSTTLAARSVSFCYAATVSHHKADPTRLRITLLTLFSTTSALLFIAAMRIWCRRLSTKAQSPTHSINRAARRSFGQHSKVLGKRHGKNVRNAQIERERARGKGRKTASERERVCV